MSHHTSPTSSPDRFKTEDLFLQAMAHINDGHLADAETLLRQLLEIIPDDIRSLAGMGLIATQQGDHATSLHWYRRALKYAPDNAMLHHAIDNALLSNTIPPPPLNADQLFQQGMNHFGAGRYDDAEIILLQLLKIRPDAGAMACLGTIASERGDLAACADWHIRALELVPKNAMLHRCAGKALLDFGNVREAQFHFLSSVAADPAQPALWNYLHAIASAEVGNKVAVQAYENCIAIDPADVRNYVALALLLEREELLDQALEIVNSGLHAVPDKRVLQISGTMIRYKSAFTRHDFDAARTILVAGVRENPGSTGLLPLLFKMNLLLLDIAAANEISLLLHDLTFHDHKKTLEYSIFREFNTNPHALKAIDHLQGLIPPMRIKRLASEMQQEPGFIGYSFALLLTLTQCGTLKRETPRATAATIPRAVVQFWDQTEIPEEIKEVMASWQEHCEGFEHHVFDDNRAASFIARHCHVRVLLAFRSAAHPAMRSDIFRLAYLLVAGGVYVDTDDRCRENLSPLLEEGFDLILLQEDIGSIGNNFIAAAPRHPMIAAALNTVVNHVLHHQGDNIWFLSGPGAMTHVFGQFYLDDLKRMRLPPGVRVRSVYQLHQFISPHVPLPCDRPQQGSGRLPDHQGSLGSG